MSGTSAYLDGQTIAEYAQAITHRISDPEPTELYILALQQLFREAASASVTTNFLEDELETLVATLEKKDRNRKVIVQLFGLDGSGIKTLDGVGQVFGLTRERVRQICDPFKKSMQTKCPYLPMLQSAIETVEAGCPNTLENIARSLKISQISRSNFDPTGIKALALLTNKSHTFELQELEHIKICTTSVDNIDPKKVWIDARKQCSKYGVVNLPGILKVFLNHKSDSIIDLLSAMPGFEWLDEDKRWFLVNTGKNRLENTLEKIFCTNSQISFIHVYSGLKRAYESRQMILPPLEIIRSFCLKRLQAHHENGMMSLDSKFDYRKCLKNTEKTIYEIMVKNQGQLARDKLEQLCISEGMEFNTFYMYLRFSPILAREKKGHYILRGYSTEEFDEITENENDTFTELDFNRFLELEQDLLHSEEDNLPPIDHTNDGSLEEEEEEELRQLIRIRQGQEEFRQELLLAYEYKCAITGSCVVEVLEAAHIAPYSGKESCTVQNGLLLRADIHTLFDKGLIKIDPSNLSIRINKSLSSSEYQVLDGKKLKLPLAVKLRPSIDLLRERYYL